MSSIPQKVQILTDMDLTGFVNHDNRLITAKKGDCELRITLGEKKDNFDVKCKGKMVKIDDPAIPEEFSSFVTEIETKFKAALFAIFDDEADFPEDNDPIVNDSTPEEVESMKGKVNEIDSENKEFNEAEEVKMSAMNQREKRQEVKGEWKKGGFDAIKQNITDEIESTKEVKLSKPKRFINNFPFSLCRVGNIKIGGKGEVKISKAGKEWQPPTRLSYFNITTMEKGTLEKDGTTEFKTDNEIMKKLGPEPKEIKVRLLFDEIENNLQASFAKYDSSGRWECRGDGVTAEQKKNNKISQCEGFECPHYKKKKDNCKLQGVLSCHLEASNMFGGVYQFRTSGFNSISYLMASMSAIKNATCGLLRGIPLSLMVLPKKVELEDGTKTDIYAVNLVYRGEREKLLKELDEVIMLREKFRFNESEYLRLAESIEVVPKDEEEQKDIADEFYGRRA